MLKYVNFFKNCCIIQIKGLFLHYQKKLTMKKFKANEHAKLKTKDLQNLFTKFMINEYLEYVKVDNFGTHQELVMHPNRALFEAHDESDFDWFVSEFFKNYKYK